MVAGARPVCHEKILLAAFVSAVLGVRTAATRRDILHDGRWWRRRQHSLQVRLSPAVWRCPAGAAGDVLDGRRGRGGVPGAARRRAAGARGRQRARHPRVGAAGRPTLAACPSPAIDTHRVLCPCSARAKRDARRSLQTARCSAGRALRPALEVFCHRELRTCARGPMFNGAFVACARGLTCPSIALMSLFAVNASRAPWGAHCEISKKAGQLCAWKSRDWRPSKPRRVIQAAFAGPSHLIGGIRTSAYDEICDAIGF